MRKAGPVKPHNRAGIWYLIRRVPKEFAALDRRDLVRISADIAVADDPKAVRAKKVVERLNTELEAYWRGLRDGQSAEARIRFEAARKRATALGLSYQTASEIRETGRLEDLVARVELLLSRNALEDEAEVAAVLGGEPKPQLRVSDMVDELEAILNIELEKLSEDQRRRWRNPKKRAMENFIEVVGDKVLAELTRADAMMFRRWWGDRIKTEGVEISTANKDFGHLQKMFSTIEMAHQVQFSPVFKGLRFGGEDQNTRSPFPTEFIQNRILAPGALDGLNKEARGIIYLMADTGLRLSEAANLLPEQIHLGAAIPYVEIKAVGRVLKTPQSERDVPLVGVSLAAMKANPAGFPRYRDKGASLSALANKYLGNHGLLPSDNHSVYSLRHSFEDRLTAIEPPEKVIAALMGHKYSRPRYGDGPTLEQKKRWMDQIAFTPPEHDV